VSYPRQFDRDEARRLYESGLSLRAVAARLGVSNTAVFYGLKAIGVPIRDMKTTQAKYIRHGKSRYKQGCRCEVCRAAVRDSKRRQRARNPEYVARANAKRMERYYRQKEAA
jgi:hypothetical protein